VYFLLHYQPHTCFIEEVQLKSAHPKEVEYTVKNRSITVSLKLQ